jgi:hypothetical protein
VRRDFLAFGYPAGQLPADGGNAPFQVPNSSLIGIFADDTAQSHLRKLDAVLIKAMLFQLAGYEEVAGYVDLLLST